MGQYYRPCILKKNWKTAKNTVKASILCYDVNNGAKLMEHSYIGNGLVRRIEYLLANDFNGYPFVWCGDYADTIETKTGSHDFYADANHFIYKDYESDDDDRSKAYNALMENTPRVWKDSDTGDYDPYRNIPYYKYLINYSKKEYCIMPKKKKGVWQVNPLPLLTCRGNGLGSGDYTRIDGRIGIWAFDRIGLSNDKNNIKGFKRISGVFKMDL